MTDIDTFWRHMSAVYGSQRWTREYPMETCGEVWRNALTRFKTGKILKAIGESARAYPDRPPTLPQFLGLCRQMPDDKQSKLPAPTKTDPRLALEHLTEVKYLMELKRGRPMTEEQRRIHWETLEIKR